LGLRDALDEAKSALNESLKLKPEIYSIARWRTHRPWYANPQFAALAEKTPYLGVRRAGFPNE
jgi:predicted nucleotidyltransferase